MTAIGDTRERKSISGAEGFEYQPFAAHVAYARNGNTHNPTVTWNFKLYRGAEFLGNFSKLSELKEAARNWDNEEYWRE